jgi:hypothetical protein
MFARRDPNGSAYPGRAACKARLALRGLVALCGCGLLLALLGPAPAFGQRVGARGAGMHFARPPAMMHPPKMHPPIKHPPGMLHPPMMGPPVMRLPKGTPMTSRPANPGLASAAKRTANPSAAIVASRHPLPNSKAHSIPPPTPHRDPHHPGPHHPGPDHRRHDRNWDHHHRWARDFYHRYLNQLNPYAMSGGETSAPVASASAGGGSSGGGYAVDSGGHGMNPYGSYSPTPNVFIGNVYNPYAEEETERELSNPSGQSAAPPTTGATRTGSSGRTPQAPGSVRSP